ncbi:Beta sliding clamp [Candidatus Magnetomoraceae bacterium gMMP-15]
MQFTINKRDILKGITKILGITGRKTNLPITTTALIQASGSQISILATDLETGFEGFYPAEVASEGKIAIPARKLFQIIKDFPCDEIIFNEIDNRWIEISADKDKTKAEYHIVSMDPEEFPEISKADDISFFDLDASVFKIMIEKVIITSASDDNRAHLAGVFFERIEEDEKQIIRMVSTDGHRLIKTEHFYEKDEKLPTGDGIIIPKKGMSELIKLLEGEGIAHIGFQESNMVVRMNEETIIIRLLEGDFPDYREILSITLDTFINIKRIPFMAMLKRMSILSSDRYSGVIFNLKKERLEITATNPELGDSKEDISAEFNGEEFKAAFNPKYFIECLNAMRSETVKISIKDADSHCLIEGEDDPHFLSVIMPMKI